MSASDKMNISPVPEQQEYPLVKFLPGNGKEYMLPVMYIARYARGPQGTCAFCDGDPCAETSDPGTPIYEYFANNKYASTCPCCDGQAT